MDVDRYQVGHNCLQPGEQLPLQPMFPGPQVQEGASCCQPLGVHYLSSLPESHIPWQVASHPALQPVLLAVESPPRISRVLSSPLSLIHVTSCLATTSAGFLSNSFFMSDKCYVSSSLSDASPSTTSSSSKASVPSGIFSSSGSKTLFPGFVK